ncbi:alpha/beta fold hydrolase [Amycolatopsis silviterrae]|uniref:Alpha/beta fold hydrolase n=1 Tax=Amycolatopsis silviterrae TaxID=1656914 RepID=A0ABW5H6Z1_9PSEU
MQAGDEAIDLPPTRTLPAGDRRIAWCELGAADGVPVLVAHGSPGSRYQLLPLRKAAEARGVRLIVPDRPGYGETSPAPERGFRAWTGDAVALLDELGLDTVTVLGFSGGAGYALGLALDSPERVGRVVLACGMLPAPPPQALAGRIPVVSLLYRVSRYAPRLAAAMLEGRGVFKNTRAGSLSAWPAADRAVMADPAISALTAIDAEAAAQQGARAAVDDLRRYYRPMDLARVRQPVRLLHGTADGNVPIGVARWGVTQLPEARLDVLPDAGHYFAAAHPETVIDALRGVG